MNKIAEALYEINTKGTIQQQAEKLYDVEKLYKKILAGYNRQIQENEDMEWQDDVFLMRKKYNVRLENVKTKMCYLNKRIIDILNIIEDFVDVEIFCELFELDYEEYDENESFYDNLLSSSTKIGHVCRIGLIKNEEFVKEMDEDNDAELTINDTKFYYDPDELEITDNILDRLKKFPAEDEAYSIYLDETQGLVIY